jgi:sulfatase modifying factor 1
MRWILPLLVCAQVAVATPINFINQQIGTESSGNVYNNTRGYSFTTKINPLKITRLGMRRVSAGGISVGIWKDDGTPIVIQQLANNVIEGGYFWATLSEAVILEPFTTYRIGGFGATGSATMSLWRQESESSVSQAVTINGIVANNEQFAFGFPSMGPSVTYGGAFGTTEYTMLVGPNFTFEVLPYDTTPPVITLIGDNPQTVYRGAVFSDLGATVTDDFDATRTITGTGTVDTFTVGTYTVTYATQDEVGNVAVPVTRTVEVVLDPNGDEDNDGLSNAEEANLGTNPYQRDTDGDGVNDLREVGDGTDPLDRASFDSLSKGLVAYYPFNGNANDESGNGHTGTLVGSAIVPSGSSGAGQALQINGTNDSWMQVADTPMLRPTATTISVWIYNNRSNNSDVRFVCGKDGEQLEIHFGNPLNPESGIRFIPTNGCYLDTVIGMPTQHWFHLVCVAGEGSGGAKIYLDGVEVGVVRSGLSDGSQPLALGTSPFFLGRRNSGYSHLDGKMDNVRIYNRVLSTQEVASLYGSEKYAGLSLEGAATKAPFDPATAANWSSGGAEWTVDTATTHDGVDSVKAQTTDGQSTFREYTVSGPAVVDFWWKVSSELGFDFFSYSLSGVQQQAISGEVDWTYRTLTLPEGTHTIRWTYSKDESGAIGEDAGWLDDFAVYPATAALTVRDGATVLDGTATLDFGETDVGSSDFIKSLTFSNEGFVPLEVELSLPEDSPFTFEGGSFSYPVFIGRGESVDVPIFLSTAVRGTKTAQLTILAPDSTTPAPQITLKGVVLGPLIGVSAAGVPITSGQNVDLGLAPCTLKFTISNTGNVGDLLISGISVTGNFQITQQPQASDFGDGLEDLVVPPRRSTTFTVLAQGGSSGVQSGTVTITSNDTFSETFSFSVGSKSLFSIGQGIAADSVATSGTGGASGWDFATTQLPNGSTGQALKTGATPNSGGSALEMVTQTAGVVSWTWKVSTQENFDWLLCEVDGQEVAGISTKNGVWQTQVVNVSAGANIRWVYRKDGSGSIGEDAGYLADVAFAPMSGDLSFAEWSATYGITDSNATLPRTGTKAVFAWLGGVDPSVGPDADHYKPIIESGRLKYRLPMSKVAEGTQKIQFSSDLSSWNSRGVSQRMLSEDGNRMVVEATAPSGTKGFFKVVGSGNTSGVMIRVQGGTLPQSSALAGTTVATFQIGRTEVTWAEWQEVRQWAVGNGYGDLAGVGVGSANNHPVRSVAWYDVAKWCNAKSEKEGLVPVYRVRGTVYRRGQSVPSVQEGANGYRLPIEAEWEWAARGGVASKGSIYSGGNDVNQVSWYLDNSSGAENDLDGSGRGTWPVSGKVENELGIHDMSGNVWEWCENFVNGSDRVVRGGSWNSSAIFCTVSRRDDGYNPTLRHSFVGFRVARNAED